MINYVIMNILKKLNQEYNAMKHQKYFIKGDEVGYISDEDNQDYGFFLPVFCSDSEEELIEKCNELNAEHIQKI